MDDMVSSDRRKWLALALLSVVQFMVVLDIAIVNVALPSIQVDLGFSQENLQWVISAYALVFGGFLLLGGRAADLLGRRRIFLAGIVLFTAASLIAGLAWSEGSLISARALQGLGAAVITPAALSILSTTFTEGRERNIALGVWGAVGGFGAAAGVLLGGILTDALSWEWIFFVNIPVGVTAFILAPILLKESRDATVKAFDVPGAVLVTGGLSSLVYAITKAGQDGWLAGQTLGFFAASFVMLVGFVAWELRHPEPLMRIGILRIKTVSGANAAGFIMGTAMFAMFLMLTLYMQQVLGYSAMKTGVGYLAVAGTAIFTSAIAAQLVTRIGVKPVLLIGMTSLTAGLVYFTQVSVGGSYLGDLLPGFLLTAVGIGFAFVPISIAALAGVQASEAGLASGLINTSQQIGGALGIAALSTIATSRTSDALERFDPGCRTRRRFPRRVRRGRHHRRSRNRGDAGADPSRRGRAGRRDRGRARVRPRRVTRESAFGGALAPPTALQAFGAGRFTARPVRHGIVGPTKFMEGDRRASVHGRAAPT
jgi:EmrB/QacA subfamily drug resistance transporter